MSKLFTGFRVKCILKPEMIQVVDALFDFKSWKQIAWRGGCKEFPFVKEWSEIEGCDQIPFADVDNFPLWEKEFFTEGYENKWCHRLVYSTRQWRFQTCATDKNLIIDFIMIVLNRMVERVDHCEVYPQNGQSLFYTFRG